MKMNQLIEWFQSNYPNIATNLRACHHNFDESDINPYHIENDCWSHTMMVCKIAEINEYDISVLVAALLHDIGKVKVRKINPKNNHVQFFNHEAVSAYEALDILYTMVDEKIISIGQVKEIFALIALHASLYKSKDNQALFAKFKYAKRLYEKLTHINRCDSLGRFAANYSDETHYTKIATNMLYKETEINDSSPQLILMCGISNSGKSTYVQQHYKTSDRLAVISRDTLVLEYGKSNNYAKAWAALSANDHKQIDEKLQELFEEAKAANKTIVIDMMHLSRKSRAIWLDAIPSHYQRSVKLCLTSLKAIFSRNSAKEGKQIPQNVIESMIERFEYPLYDEVSSVELVMCR